MPRLTPPTPTTFLISLALALAGVLGLYVPQIANLVPISMFWLVVIAYLVLCVGNLVRGI
jgi:hypothetical protein